MNTSAKYFGLAVGP